MNLEQFYSTHIDQVIETDGAPSDDPVQCVDLVKEYMRDCYGVPFGVYGNAVDYWTNTAGAILQKFDKIPTNEPIDGDIVVWGDDTGSYTGIYGHVAVAFQGRVINQNNARRKFVTLDRYVSDGVLGVLRPKSSTATQPIAPVAPQSSSNLHEIVAGDTFWDLNIAYNVPQGTLEKLNPELDPLLLQIGSKIKIGNSTDDGNTTERTYYNIVDGDTFWGLENAWGLAHGTLQQLNADAIATNLQIGQRIRRS
jgi:LysM repeat protein